MPCIEHTLCRRQAFEGVLTGPVATLACSAYTDPAVVESRGRRRINLTAGDENPPFREAISHADAISRGNEPKRMADHSVNPTRPEGDDAIRKAADNFPAADPSFHF